MLTCLLINMNASRTNDRTEIYNNALEATYSDVTGGSLFALFLRSSGETPPATPITDSSETCTRYITHGRQLLAIRVLYKYGDGSVLKDDTAPALYALDYGNSRWCDS
jgi:hypothetical protein